MFGPKTGPRSLLFRCFFENGDFVKIVLPLWWEQHFQGSDPPKIDSESDSERQRREKPTKIGSGAVSGRTFSVPGLFLVDFRFPAGPEVVAGLAGSGGRHRPASWKWWPALSHSYRNPSFPKIRVKSRDFANSGFDFTRF